MGLLSKTSLVLAGCFLSFCLSGVGADSTPSRGAIDTLSQDELDRALESVWARSTPLPETPYDPLESRKIAFEKSLLKLGPGAGIISGSSQKTDGDEPSQRFLAELLPGKIGFIRPGKIAPDRSTRLEAALQDFAQVNANAIILDLRNTSAGSLRLAAELAANFVPKGTTLFSARNLRSQKSEPHISTKSPTHFFQITVLVSTQTSGAAEVWAECLRTHCKAFILGQPTAGLGADYTEIPISENHWLRMPAIEAVFEKHPGPFPKGLQPDMALSISNETTSATLLQIALDGKVTPHIQEISRPRFNEAALVANRNPDTENWIREQLGKTKEQPPQKQVLKDTALLRALDFIEARNALQATPSVANQAQ